MNLLMHNNCYEITKTSFDSMAWVTKADNLKSELFGRRRIMCVFFTFPDHLLVQGQQVF